MPTRFWMILGLMLISAIVYWPSTAALYEAWTDFHGLGYTHGPLIVIICIALLYRRRWEIESAPARRWPLALAALAICSLAWLVCYRASIQDLHVLLFPAAIALAVAAVWGPQVARIAALPVLFFYFASSAWGEFSPYLQALTVLVTRGAMDLTGMDVTVIGDVIRMPFGSTFVVESGCSGLHFLLVGLAVATLHGELRDDPVRLRITHVVVMGFLALVSNWVRVYTVVRAGYETHMRHVLVSGGHYYFGWMVFAFALAIFFWLARRYSRSADAAAGVASSSSGSIAPQPAADRSARVHAAALGIGAATLSMIAAPTLSYALKWVQGGPAVPHIEFVALKEDPGSAPAADSVWKPVFAGADVLERRQYSGAGGTIEALAVAYSRQSQGSELIGETSSLTGSGLEVDSEQRIRSGAGDFIETVARAPDGRKSVLWSRYEIGGRPLTVPVLAQVWYGLGSLVSDPLAGLVALRTDCVPDCTAARRRIENVALQKPVRLTGVAGASSAQAQ